VCWSAKFGFAAVNRIWEWTVRAVRQCRREELAASRQSFLSARSKFSKAVNSNPQEDLKEGSWKVSNPVNTKDFFQARRVFLLAVKLYKELKVPVGIINSDVGRHEYIENLDQSRGL